MKFLSTFLTQFKHGFQKSSRYKCQLFVPPALLQNIVTQSTIGTIINVFFPNVGQRIDPNFSMPTVVNWLAQGLLVEQTRLPTRALETTTNGLYGYTEKYPYHTEHTDLDCTFMMPLVESDCPIPRFFNYWQNFIQAQQNGPGDGMDFRFPSEYYGTLFLALYDHKTSPSLMYRFDNVYPEKVDSSNVSWESNNEYLKVNVQFAYSYWTIVPYTAPPIVEIDIPL